MRHQPPGGQHRCLRCCRRSGFSGAPQSRSSTQCRWSHCSSWSSRRWWNSWWTFFHLSISVLLSRLSKCPRLWVHPALLAQSSVRRRRQNSWWKCRRATVTLLLSWPCKPWGGVMHGLCLSSSTPPAQGGKQILGRAEAVVDVSVLCSLSSRSLSSIRWRCLRLSSSTEWWFSCFTETGTQCENHNNVVIKSKTFTCAHHNGHTTATKHTRQSQH